MENNLVPINSSINIEELEALDLAGVVNLTKNMSLHQLVASRKTITEMIMRGSDDAEIDPELEELYNQAADLIAGKIDRVGIFVKEVIPAHIAACKEQIKRLQFVETRVKELTIDAIRSIGPNATRIEGLAYRARIQANPPSIIVDNPDIIPMMFKKGTVTITAKFDPSNATARAFWEEQLEFYKQKMKVSPVGDIDGHITIEPDNQSLREVMLDKKDKKGELFEKGIPVDGATVEQGVHVRFEAGKAKPKMIAAKKSNTKEVDGE